MPLRMSQSPVVERPPTSVARGSVCLITPPSAVLLDERVFEHSMGQGLPDFIHCASRANAGAQAAPGLGVRKLG
jgi:hypothetical protein